MIRDRVLSYKNPLYGRRTTSLKLKPLNFFHLIEFFPHLQWEELVEIYGFADGIPCYLEKIKLPFWKWIEKELKTPDTFLKDELDFLMKYELSDTTTYKRILEPLCTAKTHRRR
ncbi:hypothetical protein LPQ35_05050 [Geoglobus acetivorans]|uniref:Uncharacterized protein n=1 Tax=Geoglobus acetivorans TaxID=565033 RepID=A0ABZ3H7I2_GEOAI